MRAWIPALSLTFALALTSGPALAAPAGATPPPASSPAVAVASPTPAPTRTPTPAPSPATAPTAAPARTAPPTPPLPAARSTPAASPAPRPTSGPADSILGFVFLDADADREPGADEEGVADVEVRLTDSHDRTKRTRTSQFGVYRFDHLLPGDYRLAIATPGGRVVTSDAEREVHLDGKDSPAINFGLLLSDDPRAAAFAQPPADGEAEAVEAPREAAPESDPTLAESPTPESEDEEVAAPGGEDGEQVAASTGALALPLRFALGRDPLAQVQKRVAGDGVVWLGVPFRTQIDGSEFQFVNCGPASLTMILAAFGLEVGPSQVRDYLNALVDNFDRQAGTSLDVLANIGRRAGLVPIDLYADRGGYRDWTIDAVRWHIEQGHPVMTLVKYRELPGHAQSPSDSDHYIVISGLMRGGFIYNDAAFATTLGYGLAITDEELQQAWEDSSIPHQAAAFALPGGSGELSFPEQSPRRPGAAAQEAGRRTGRLIMRVADDDENLRPPTSYTPRPLPSPVATASATSDDVDASSVDPGPSAPAGFLTPGADGETLAADSPGRIAPRVAVLAGLALAMWWAASATPRALRGVRRGGYLLRVATRER